jgi:hypothetical protein
MAPLALFVSKAFKFRCQLRAAVGNGPNEEIESDDRAKALGADTINEFAKHTGMSRSEAPRVDPVPLEYGLPVSSENTYHSR